MDQKDFFSTSRKLIKSQERFLNLPNKSVPGHGNGIYERYKNPVLTRDHVPLSWRFDFNHVRNPHLLERLGVNAVFNAGAIEHNGAIHVVARVEGNDRKSFFAVASSESGIDRFHFAAKPVALPLTDEPDVNVYDMRLTRHEDGYIYGVFCTERKDPKAPAHDTSSAVAQCGIVRTKDLVSWERLSDIKTESPQQRNVVLHPEFVNGQYAFYTRPQDDFIQSGSGGGIGFGLSKSIERAEIPKQVVVDPRLYHTIKEVKNGAGAPPIKTAKGWLHIAHGVRNTAAGMRYVLYVLLCDPDDPSRVIASPGGYFIAPTGDERIGDVSNVVFCNGAVARDDGSVFIYYASSDTRLHVATSSVERLLDYALNTPPDGLTTQECVKQRINLIERNEAVIGTL